MRIVIFGSSIVSDWNNPIALSVRPIVASLIADGHDVVFLEERGNRWMAGMLKAQGMRQVRAFSAAFPTIQYRTYELARGYERTVWFAQSVGTADAIVALWGTSEPVLEQISAFHSPSVVRAVFEGAGFDDSDIALGLAGQSESLVPFGPAAAKRTPTPHDRNSIALVAYDWEMAETALRLLAPSDILTLDQSGEQHHGFPYRPEVELPDVYDQCETVIVTGDWTDPASWARFLVPLASGCHVFAVGPGLDAVNIPGLTAVADASHVTELVGASPKVANQSRFPGKFDAFVQSANLVGALRSAHAAKRRLRT